MKHLQLFESFISERKGIWKDEWDEGDTILTLYFAKYGTVGLGLTAKEIAENVIGSSFTSLNKQAANMNYLMGIGNYKDYSKLQEEIYNKYKTSTQNELRQICLRIIEERGDTVVKQRIVKLNKEKSKKDLHDEFRKRGFDPYKMKSLGERPTLQSMLEDPNEITESAEQKLDYSYQWTPEYKYSITVYEKEDKIHLSWLTNDGVKLFKKKYPKAVISVSSSEDGHYLDDAVEFRNY